MDWVSWATGWLQSARNFGAGNWVAIIAAAFAGLAWRETWRMVGIEHKRDRKAELEAGKANVVARIEREANHMVFLVIENRGPSTARTIQVSLDDAPLDGHPLLSKNWPGPELDELSSNGTATYMVFVTTEARPARIVVIKWSDDSGKAGHYRSQLAWKF